MNVTDNKIETKFKVDDSMSTWGLKLSKVDQYKNRNYAYINVGQNFILAPYEFLSYLVIKHVNV